MKKKIILSTFTSIMLFASAIVLSACASTSKTEIAEVAIEEPVANNTASYAGGSASAIMPAPGPTPGAAIYGASNTITVNSSEIVTVVPDIAEVVYAVKTQNKNAAACQTKNTEDVNKVIELLKSLNIAETSIQTSDYYMYPVYNYSGNTQKITGYEATTTLTVSDLPIDSLGDILTKSVSSGINTIQSVTYEASTYDAGYQEALKLAVNSAYAKAQALAEASGCSVGGVVSITENSRYSQARYTDNALVNKQAAAGMAMQEDAAVNVMPGEVEVGVDITVQYQIQ